MLRKTTCRHIERSEISQIAEEKRGFLGRAFLEMTLNRLIG